MTMPRPEHPKMQLRRDNWQNLNGQWQFEIDNGRSGIARGLMKNDVALNSEITVPFCPESDLSGVGHKDFMYGVWYKRTITVSEEQLAGLVRLHFGAVDYKCTVYVNEKKVGTHVGGYVSFYFDIAEYLVAGENTITVYAEDDTRDPLVPRGKQSEEFYSHGCDYTRTTGIWQTVWVEFLPIVHLERFRVYPDAVNGKATLVVQLSGAAALTVKASYEGKPMGEVTVDCMGGHETIVLDLAEKHLWEVGEGRLYDLELTYGDDVVHSYFGLRTVSLDGGLFRLNGKIVFQRLVLDQGFYPDGVYTAPTDAELLGDIERSMAMGFNGARLHEKVFEERFLYHADRLGYLVWGEYPDWGMTHLVPEAIYAILPEWLEEIERDFNHPAIIGWCPLNEVWDRAELYQDWKRPGNVWDKSRYAPYAPLMSLIYRATKAADSTRPCVDTSGGYHVETDVFDLHDYTQDLEEFAKRYPADGSIPYDQFGDRQTYRGEAIFNSEYGGIGFSIDSTAWSYGSAARTQEEYIARFKGLTEILLRCPKVFGLCYTQLTDVEQEQNGVYTFDRRPKVDPEVFHAILTQKAAIEEE